MASKLVNGRRVLVGSQADPESSRYAPKVTSPAIRREVTLADGTVLPPDQAASYGRTTTPEVTRYDKGATGSTTDRYTAEFERMYGKGGVLSPSPVSALEEQQLRAKLRGDVQSQINAIQELGAIELSKATQRGVERSGKGRALGAAAGLIGSPDYDRRAGEIGTLNAEDEAAQRATTQLKVQEVLKGVDQRARDIVDKRNTNAQTNAGNYLSYLRTVVDDARANLQELAASGATLSARQKRTLMQQTGYDSETFDSLYKSIEIANSNQYLNKDKPQIIGNTAVYFKQTRDPKTGAMTITTEEVKLPEGPAEIESTVSRDDGIYVLYKDGSYKKIGQPKATGGGGGSGTPGTYTAGADPVVDAWVERIQSGQSKITEIPASQASLRNAVTRGLVASGNSADGKPTTTELGKAALTSAKSLLQKFDAGEGTSAVGKSAFLNSFGTGFIPGTQRANFVVDFDALKAQLALEGVKYLKGQGAVSDAERELLKQATTKLNRAQTEAEFKKSLESIISKLEGAGSAESVQGAAQDAYAARGTLTSPDGSQEVSTADLTPEELTELKNQGWQ